MQAVSFVNVPDVGEWDHPGVALSIEEFREVLTVLSPINRRRFIFAVTTMIRRVIFVSHSREGLIVREMLTRLMNTSQR